MYIRLDIFAEMLGIRPKELRHAIRTGNGLDGLDLPEFRKVRGATVMFDHDGAIAFSQNWHVRAESIMSPPEDKALIPLGVFAKQVGIAPLALWHAVCTGKRLKGVLLPVATKSAEGALMFDSDSVEQFINKYLNADSDK